jgi:hypothetical protein
VHPLDVAAQGPGGHGVEERRGDPQQLHRVPGGRRVEHDQVPPRAAAVLDANLVQDLPQHHQLGQRRDDAEEVAHDPVLEDRVVDAAELQHHRPVLAHGLARRHVHGGEAGEHLAHDRAGGCAAEEGRDPLLRVDLADEDAQPAPDRDQREGRGDGGLADPALSRDDVQPAIEEGERWHGLDKLTTTG